MEPSGDGGLEPPKTEQTPAETAIVPIMNSEQAEKTKLAEVRDEGSSDSDSGEELVPVRVVRRPPMKLVAKKPKKLALPAIVSTGAAASPKDEYDPHMLEDYWLKADEIDRRNANRCRRKQPAEAAKLAVDPSSDIDGSEKVAESVGETPPTLDEYAKETPTTPLRKVQSVLSLPMTIADRSPKSSADEDETPQKTVLGELLVEGKGPPGAGMRETEVKTFSIGAKMTEEKYARRGETRTGKLRVESYDAQVPSAPLVPSLHHRFPSGYSPPPRRPRHTKPRYRSSHKPAVTLSLNTPGDIAGAYFAASRSIRSVKSSAGLRGTGKFSSLN